MSYNVDKLMSDYSCLSEEETKEFDKRYREHKQFGRMLNSLVKNFVANKKAKAASAKPSSAHKGPRC